MYDMAVKVVFFAFLHVTYSHSSLPYGARLLSLRFFDSASRMHVTSNYTKEIASMLLSTPCVVILLQCPLCCDVCFTSFVRLCCPVLCYVKGYHKPENPCFHMLHIHLPPLTQEERPCNPIVYLGGMTTNPAAALKPQAIVRQREKYDRGHEGHRQKLTHDMLLAHLNIQLLDNLDAALEQLLRSLRDILPLLRRQ